MKNRLYYVFLGTVVLVCPLTSDKSIYSAQNSAVPVKYENQVPDINIKTIILHKEGTPLTLPAINLNAGEKLELHFDDLSAQQRSFSYTLIHCNKEWEQSALEQQEYLDGYGSGRIEITSTSFNTTYNYFHHSIVFPVEEAYPRISGNYALVVYENDNPEDVVLVRQFYVHESLVTVEASCIQPSGEKYGTGQEIECSLNHEGYSIINPDSDITILIRQNMNSRSDIKITKPRFIGPATINYGGRNEIIFDGGNEFRYFDIKSMKYEAENITSIDFQKPYYHVFLKTGESRAFDPYFTQQDINGRFYIETEGSEDRHKEADYVVVHFSLSAQIPFTDGEVYITGALCEGFPEDDFRMSFNPDKRQYEKALLLKQGFYNYMFVYCPKGSETCDMGYLEGNHYETANEYVVFVYHYDSSWDYDRLIAIKQFRSK